jgi:methyl-accepting chemotaxis protein
MRWRRLEAAFALRRLRIATRLALGFCLVAGLLLALVAAIAYFGHLQRESLAASIDAAVERDAALGSLKAIVQDRTDYLRDVGTRIGLAGALREGGELHRLSGELAQALGQLESAHLGAREREAAARMRALENDYARAVKDAAGKADDAAAVSSFQSLAATVARKQAAEIDRLTENSLDSYKVPVATFVERGRLATKLVVIVTAAIALVVALVAAGITRGITRPLRVAVDAVTRVSSGDLTGRVDARGRDEAADLLRAVQSMNVRLGGMVAGIRRSADEVAANAAHVAEGNEKLAERTEEQASSLEESAATIEEFTSTVKRGADGATQASALAAEVSAMARAGGASMGTVVTGMGELAQASRRIREIVGVIDAIAFQTNILALNAAVEAARAGEEGRGFAVVAGEVRALAGRAAESAREIGALIASSVQQVEASAQAVDRAGGNIDTLVGAVDRVCELMSSIAAGGREQASGIEQINRAITQMDSVVQKNAALVSQASAAARSLDEQAAQLVESVSSFRVEDAEAPATREADAPRVEPALKALPAPSRYASTGRR